MSNIISPFAQEYLNQIPNTITYYFMEFSRVQASQQYDFYAFIEGNDAPFYTISCENILGKDKTYFIRCDGKKNAIELVEYLYLHSEESYRNSNFFALVDNDYGLETIKYEVVYKIYQTPCYSFENLYLGQHTFKKILNHIFHTSHFGLFSNDYGTNMQNYESRLNDYIQLILIIDKKYHATRISKALNEGLPNYKSDFISLKNLKVEIDKVYIKSNHTINDCFDNKKFPIESCYTDTSFIKAEIKYLDKSVWENVKIIRGKFLIKFLAEYLNKLKVEFCNNSSGYCFSQRATLKASGTVSKNLFYKCNYQADDVSILSVLAQYAEQPECLINFLKNIRDSAKS